MQRTINRQDFAHMNLAMSHERVDPLSTVSPGLILHLKTGTLAKNAHPAFPGDTGFDGESRHLLDISTILWSFYVSLKSSFLLVRTSLSLWCFGHMERCQAETKDGATC